MREVALAFSFGLLVGAVFGFAKQPIPAPPTVAGAAGVLGVTLGFMLLNRIRG